MFPILHCLVSAVQRRIGTGAHGQVFEGQTTDGRTVACKVTAIGDTHSSQEMAAVSPTPLHSSHLGTT